MVFHGIGAYIGIGENTSNYTGRAPTITQFIPMKGNTDGLTTAVENIFTEEITNSARTVAGTQAGRIKVDGSIAHEAFWGTGAYPEWGKLMTYLCASGQVIEHIALDEGLHTGTWDFANSTTHIDNKSLTFEVYRGETNSSFFYEACWVNSLDVNMSENANVEFSWGIVGRDSVSGAKNSPSFSAADHLVFPNPNCDTATFLTWGGTSPAAVIKSASISINRNWNSDRFHICSQKMDQPTFGDVSEVTCTFEAEFDTQELFDDFKAKTKKDLVLLAQGTGQQFLEFTLRNCIITDGGEPKVSDRGPVMYSCTVQALADPTVPENPLQVKLCTV